MSIEELQSAIAQLPPEELDRFSSGSRIFWPISGTGVSRLISWPGVWMLPLVVPTSSSRQDTTHRFSRESLATPEFWFHYRRLPAEIRELADRCFAMLQADPRHPSLRLKKVCAFWSARIGVRVRALARDRPEGSVWFWIGPHDRYEELIA